MEKYELTPTDSRKSFYGKAFIEVAADGSETRRNENPKGENAMTSCTEKAIRISDLTVEAISAAIDAQSTYTDPDAGKYFGVSVEVTSDDAEDRYGKEWTKEDFFECPEIKKWLKEEGAEEWTEEDLAGYDIAGVFTGSATYLKGLKSIIDDIKKDFAPDAIVTLE